jgi:7-carboxy-7-deazaguanine synthase
MDHAGIQEIFSSIQGEGPWIGERHIFVRFLGCELKCRYCDTPASALSDTDPDHNFCRVQADTRSNDRILVPNPVDADALSEYCSRLVIAGPSRPTISLTGGEPLLHREFLLSWLPRVRDVFTIYLETGGVDAGSMKELLDLVDVVSMDFKLPSATGMRAYWDEHRRFLSSVLGKRLVVKAVVTRDTVEEDVLTSARIIAGSGASIPFVLQPASGALAPGPAMLLEFQNAALRIIADVRVIPQAHKALGVP